jgi:hypothetical protein
MHPVLLATKAGNQQAIVGFVPQAQLPLANHLGTLHPDIDNGMANQLPIPATATG